MFTSAIRAMQFEDWVEIEAEFNRLSLHSDDIPGGGLAIGGDEALQQFLAHLRGLSPGATWRDVLPDLPEHWYIDDPESWTFPYHPIGPFDYPRLPAGPVIMTSCGVEHDESIVRRVIDDARVAGFAIYGAGIAGEMSGETRERLIRIVMEHGTTEEPLSAFTQWIAARDDLRFDGVSRGIERPVIYQTDAEYAPLSEATQWRHVRFDLSTNPPVDFTWEREWRIRTDELMFSPHNVRVVVPDRTVLEWLRERHARDQDYLTQAYGTIMGQELAEAYREDFPWEVVNLRLDQLLIDDAG